jgi:hypothetical protein
MKRENKMEHGIEPNAAYWLPPWYKGKVRRVVYPIFAILLVACFLGLFLIYAQEASAEGQKERGVQKEVFPYATYFLRIGGSAIPVRLFEIEGRRFIVFVGDRYMSMEITQILGN